MFNLIFSVLGLLFNIYQFIAKAKDRAAALAALSSTFEKVNNATTDDEKLNAAVELHNFIRTKL